MIASLASFTGQYSPELIEKGRVLHESGQAGAGTINKGTYNFTVIDGSKKRQVSVRLQAAAVTDIFCTCGPAVCPHVVAVFFALQKELDIQEQPYVPEVKKVAEFTDTQKENAIDILNDNKTHTQVKLEKLANSSRKSASARTEPRYSKLGNTLNNLVYVSRAMNTKDGELEALGEHTSLKDLTASKLEKKAVGSLTGYDLHPVFNGAKKLLGAAIREYEEGNYEAVLAVAKAILTGIMNFGNLSNSGQECCDAAVALLDELYNGKRTSATFKDRVFNWVLKAWRNEAYEEYEMDLICVIGNNPQTEDHKAALLKAIRAKADDENSDGLWGEEKDIMLALLLDAGDEDAAKEWKERYASHFRKRMIAEAMEQEDYRKAKQLAAEGLSERDAEECWKTLYTIATIEKDPVGIRNYYIYLFLKDGQMSDYEIARAGCSEEEWKEILPVIIRELEKQYMRADLFTHVLVREGLYDALLKHIRYKHIDRVLEVAPVLMESHGDEMLNILRGLLIDQANRSKQREPAKVYADYLRRVRAFKGGKRMVSQMLTDLFEKYPGWNVLRSEVEKYM